VVDYMAKSNKPYSDSGNNKASKKKKSLEYTTRIRVDRDRLNDYDSLDTSFLEGRLDKKVKNQKISKEKLYKEKRQSKINWDIVKSVFFLLVTLCVIIVIIVFVSHQGFSKKSVDEDSVVVEEKEKKEEKVIDDNYLFVGDFHTEKFDFEELDYHYVKEADDNYTTDDILEDIKNKVYLYNPSIIFIELGLVDLDEGKSVDEIIDNMENIIDSIKENRPYAKIYIESIYPINKDVADYDGDILDDGIDNELIIDLNKKIKSLSKEKEVKYFDVYSFISENDKLNDDYTDNGIYLNEDGYKRILKEIKRVVE